MALAGAQAAALRDWVRDALDVAATEGEVVKINALMINERLGDPVRPGVNLAGFSGSWNPGIFDVLWTPACAG